MRPPRAPHDEADGIVFLPRNIDKARAALPGGNLGEYFLERDDIRTLSGLFFRRFSCTQNQFIAVVAAAGDDATVAAWLRSRVEAGTVERWNQRVRAMRMKDIDPATQDFLRERYRPATWSDDDLLLDMLHLDDRRSFTAGY